ncbi:MAG: GNAT family N-acetyltransferase [Sulfitobacter sp.]
MSVSRERLFATSEATWPPARQWDVGPVTLRDGQGGGQRVSAATISGAVNQADLETAEAGMRDLGQSPLFQVREDAALDAMLEARGYAIKDATVLYTLPVARLTDIPIPRVTAFDVWEPLAIMNEIWATDGIGPSRRAVMDRVKTKTGVFSRWQEQPAGAAFVGLHGGVAMVHGLVVLPHQRRQGVAEWMMRRAAFWGQAHGAQDIAALCVEANAGANGLYRSLGFEAVGRYHYRKLQE